MLKNLKSKHLEIRTVKRSEINPSRREEWNEMWKKKDPYALLESYSKSMIAYQESGHEVKESIETPDSDVPIIILDRCIDTALATAVGCGMTLDEALDRIPHTAIERRPHVIQLKAPERQRLHRCRQRGEDREGSPKLDSELQERITSGYEDIARIFPTTRISVTNMDERDQLYNILDRILLFSGVTVSERFAMLHALWNNMEPKTVLPDLLDNWVMETQVQIGSIARLAVQSARGIETDEIQFEKELQKQVTDLIYSAINMLYKRDRFPDLSRLVTAKLVQDYLKLRNRIPIGKT
jgi:thymidylate kinase